MPGSVGAQRRVLAGYVVAGAGTALAFLVGRGQVQDVAVAVANLLAMLAALVGARRWARDRGFALAVAAGLALMSAEYVRRLVLHMGHATNGDGLTGALIALTYLCLLGAGVVVVLRHPPSDK